MVQEPKNQVPNREPSYKHPVAGHHCWPSCNNGALVIDLNKKRAPEISV